MFRTMWDNPVGGTPFKMDAASDAAAAAAAAVTPPVTPSAVTPPAPAPATELPAFEDLRNLLPEELKVEKSLDSYKGKEGTANFIKTFISAQKMAGVALKLPAEGMSDEEKGVVLKDVYTKLGCPEKAEYTINVAQEVKDSGTFSEETQRTFFAKAHELGLNTKQVQALTDWQIGEVQKSLETSKEEYNKALGELKVRWGPNDQRNRELADRAFKAVANPKQAQLANAIGLLNHPEFVEMFYNIGTKLAESNVIIGDVEGATTKEEAQSRINEIMADPKSPYKHSRDPKHKDQQLEMERLHRIIHGDKLYPTG